MRFLDAFAHTYVLDVAPDWPELGEQVISFPSHQLLGMRSNVFHDIRFYPEKSASWMGRFEWGERGKFEHAVLSTPDQDEACVVSCGAGYWVNVERRTSKGLELQLPIMSAEASRKHALIVVTTWRDVVAYRSAEPVWCLRHIGDDDLHIAQIDEDIATLVGFIRGGDAEIQIDLASGKLIKPPER